MQGLLPSAHTSKCYNSPSVSIVYLTRCLFPTANRMEELPQWQSARKHDRIRAMMVDQKQLLERETQVLNSSLSLKIRNPAPCFFVCIKTFSIVFPVILYSCTPSVHHFSGFHVHRMGIMHDAQEKAFSGDLVRSFFNLREFEVYKPVSHVFLAIDPNAGGQSRFAIVSCIYMKGVCAIIGMEAINTHKPADYEGVLIEHIAALKARPNLRNALVVLMPEANLGFEAHYIERCVMQSRFARCCVTMRDKEQPGLRTTHAVKESMYIKTKAAFADEAVRFTKNTVNVNPETTVESMKKDLEHEMRTYSIIIDHPMSVFAQSKKTFSGKIGGFQDDLVVCLQLNILWHTQFYIDSKYGPYR